MSDSERERMSDILMSLTAETRTSRLICKVQAA
eukprot:COSAG06_NODE_62080_length_266_cov_0.598802_1_plen_32_part_01